MTPIWAATVAPVASARALGRNGRRSANGVASASIAAVAPTESWKPTDQTSAGSTTSNPNTAAARTVAVLRGRPRNTPRSVSPAITPARSTDGSAPVSTTKNTTVPSPSPNLGHRERRSRLPSASIGARTIATFSPETTSMCESPLARKSRSIAGSRRESSPSASPIRSPASRGGNSDPIEDATSARNDCAHRITGNVRGAEPHGLVRLELGDEPVLQQEPAEPGVLGDEQPARDPDPVAANRVRRVVLAARPHRLVDGRRGAAVGDEPGVDDGRPPVGVHVGIGSQRPLDDDAGRCDPGQVPALDPVGVRAAPPDPQRDGADEGQQRRRHRRSATPHQGGRGHGLEARIGAREARDLIGRRRPAGCECGRGGERGQRERQPQGHRQALADERAGEQAEPHPAREPREQPPAQTVTRSRMLASVASPMPLTSSSSSTVAKGPFCVR